MQLKEKPTALGVIQPKKYEYDTDLYMVDVQHDISNK